MTSKQAIDIDHHMIFQGGSVRKFRIRFQAVGNSDAADVCRLFSVHVSLHIPVRDSDAEAMAGGGDASDPSGNCVNMQDILKAVLEPHRCQWPQRKYSHKFFIFENSIAKKNIVRSI